jgi:transposase
MIFVQNVETNSACCCKENYVVYVKIILSRYRGGGLEIMRLSGVKTSLYSSRYEIYLQEHLTFNFINDIIFLTLLQDKKEGVNMKDKNDPKAKTLSAQGVLNQRPDRVKDPLFRENEFFDPRDLVQVKYEMIRKVTTDGTSVVQAAQDFGFSRPSFYQAQLAFVQEGLPGLIPRKRGPRTRHKITNEVMKFIDEVRAENASISPKDIAAQVQSHFGMRVHQRSIERAMRDKKKR